MNRSITVVAVAAAAMVGVAPTAWAATTSPTVRSVTPSDLGTWNPSTTTTPSTPWFVLPGDQTGGGTYRFLPPTGSSQGGLQLSAPSSGDSIAVATVPPVTTNTANLDVTFDVEALAQVPKVFQVQTWFVDLDCNGPAAGGVVRAEEKTTAQNSRSARFASTATPR